MFEDMIDEERPVFEDMIDEERPVFEDMIDVDIRDPDFDFERIPALQSKCL